MSYENLAIIMYLTIVLLLWLTAGVMAIKGYKEEPCMAIVFLGGFWPAIVVGFGFYFLCYAIAYVISKRTLVKIRKLWRKL